MKGDFGLSSAFLRFARILLGDPALPIALTAVFAVVGMIAQESQAPGHDLSWLLLATQRLLEGADLYGADLFEWNPPLFLYYLSPAVLTSQIVGLDAIDCARIELVSTALAVLWLSNHILAAHFDEIDVLTRRYLGAALCFVFFLLPGDSFGQREHLILVFAVPYALVIAARLSEIAVTTRVALVSGFGMGFAIGIKPHYAVAIVLGEILLAAWRRDIFHVWRSEVLALVGFGLVYLVSVVALTPGYFDHVIPVAFDTYWVYQIPLRSRFEMPDLLLLGAALAAPLLLRHRDLRLKIELVFSVGALGFYLASVLQGTRWPYHDLPFRAFAILSLCWPIVGWAADFGAALPAVLRKRGLAVVAGGLVLVLLMASPTVFGRKIRNGGKWRAGESVGAIAAIEETLRRHASGGSVYVVSPSMLYIFPAVNRAGVGWSSRFSAFFIPAVLERFERGDPMAPASLTAERVRDLEVFLRDSVIEDFARRPPDLVLIDRARHRRVFRGAPFDFLAFLLEDPRFADIWAGYREIEGVERFSAAVRR